MLSNFPSKVGLAFVLEAHQSSHTILSEKTQSGYHMNRWSAIWEQEFEINK